MIHSSHALQERFDKKEEEIFEMNLEFNGASRSLFEELLRKNNEIIKLCINSFSEATASNPTIMQDLTNSMPLFKDSNKVK
jgi:hypothetical protein